MLHGETSERSRGLGDGREVGQSVDGRVCLCCWWCFATPLKVGHDNCHKRVRSSRMEPLPCMKLPKDCAAQTCGFSVLMRHGCVVVVSVSTLLRGSTGFTASWLTLSPSGPSCSFLYPITRLSSSMHFIISGTVRVQ